MTEPSVLGAYRIVGKIGDGAMGIVYEGRHDVLGRRVAIKVLRAEVAREPQVATRFLNEAKAANVISHENIVNVYDVGETADGLPYLVMELLEGETLAELEKRGPLVPRQVSHVFVPILRALAAAHARGVVHRDLKPANVFLVARPAGPPLVKLLDFGVAKLSAEWAQKMTRTGVMIGTPMYMSPEQISGKSAEPRSDLFTCGVMIYEALVGEPPFRGATMAELAHQILNVTPPPPSAANARVTPAIDQVVARAMSKGLDDRYPTATDMMESLDAAIGGPGRTLERPAAAVGSRRAPVWVGVGLAVMGAGAAAAYVAGRRSSPAPVVAPPPPPPPVKTDDERRNADETLRGAILSHDLGEAGDALAALELAATPRTAPIIYLALGGPPELRRQAAHILERLALPEAAPRVRAALDASGERLRVELASVLAALGDREVNAILRRGVGEPGTRLWAAVGLVAAGESEAARPVLSDILTTSPRGRAEWSRAAGALLALGDEPARAALLEELAQPDAARAVAAAALLAKRGQADGRAFLGRVVADPSYPRRGEAALELARLGDRAALAFVPAGLGSADAEERRLAAAVAALLADVSQRPALVKLFHGDGDRRTRLTAAAAVLAVSEAP